MALILFLILLVGICVLAPFFGADSRYDGHGRHRANW